MKIALAITFAVACLVGCDAKDVSKTYAPVAPAIQTEISADEERSTLVQDCNTNGQVKMDSYRKLMLERAYWAAALELRICSQLLGEKGLVALVTDAEVKSYVQDIDNSKAGDADRVRSIEALTRYYPEQAKRYKSLHAKLVSKLERQSNPPMAMRYEGSTSSGMDCYKVGYRFSKCALATAAGISCPADWNFAVPTRCQGTRDLQRGIDEGTADFAASARKIVN